MIRGYHGLWVPEKCDHCNTIALHAHRYGGFRENFSGSRVALDLGAHVGYWSLLMAPHFYQVWSYEANKENYLCLYQNVKESEFDHILPVHAAVGREIQPYKMRYNLESKPNNSGAWHVIPDRDGVDLMVPLDNVHFGDKVDLIKMDVEGMEAEVIQGARRLIEHDKPAIIAELNKAASENYGRCDEGPRHELYKMGYKERLKLGGDVLFIYCGV